MPRHAARLRPALILLLALTVAPRAALAGDPEVAHLEQQLANLDLPRMYVGLDKPLYQPGETVWFRAWELSMKSGQAYGDHTVTFQLIDPRGAAVLEKVVYAQGGLATNDFELPLGMVGGEYTLRATSDRGVAADRPLIVSVYEPPRIKKKLEFVRKAYGPGDLVSATVELQRATGEVLARTPFTILVVLDDQELFRQTETTDADGKAMARFALPTDIARGDGLLTILVDDGGVTESIQKRIPITLDRIQLQLYPEGGDLVEGLESRVYFQARSLIGKPVDLAARVVDDRGKVLDKVESFHNGLGRFTLRPEPGRSYELVVTQPTSVQQRAALPAPRTEGCTLRARDDFSSERAAIEVDVQCTTPRRVVVTAVLRGALVAHQTADVAAGGATISLPIAASAQGAVRVTLFGEGDGTEMPDDAGLTPLAERLVYRGVAASLEVELTADKTDYTPREQVRLTLKVTDGDGKPVSGEFSLAVVDDTVLSYADDKTANILAGMLLLPEMPGQVIEEPNFYFSEDPKAPQAMDLLLGTQGWRRFEWQWVTR